MNSPGKTALVAGATGLIGNHCLQLLLDDTSYNRVIALVRKELPLNHPKLVQHAVNFDKLAEHASSLKADDVFCCLGTTIKKAGSQAEFRKVDFQYPAELARIALANGAKQYLLVTAMGANKASLVFYNRVKGEVEEAVKKAGYKTVHIFRPSLLLGERKEARTGEHLGKIFFRIASPLFVGALKKYKAIEGKTVARAMIQCARENRQGIFMHESDEIEKMIKG